MSDWQLVDNYLLFVNFRFYNEQTATYWYYFPAAWNIVQYEGTKDLI